MLNQPTSNHETFTIPGQGTFILLIHSDLEREAIELISLQSEITLVKEPTRRNELQRAIAAQIKKIQETIKEADVAEWEQDSDDAAEMLVGR